MREQMLSEKYQEPPCLAVKKAEFTPPPADVEPVPEEYLHLVGKHARHPGTGKNLGKYGRWAFAEFTEVYQIQTDFEKKVEEEFNAMIDRNIL